MTNGESQSNQPHVDPIVEEVRRARREYFAECGNDMKRMLEDIRRRQAEHPERLASFRSEVADGRRRGTRRKSA